jgi:hypothetical protein
MMMASLHRKTSRGIRADGATYVVFLFVKQRLSTAEISERSKLPAYTVSKALKRLLRMGCIALVQKVGNSKIYHAIRHPTVIAPKAERASKKPYYLPHKVNGLFPIIQGEPSSKRGHFMGCTSGLKGGTVQMNFAFEGIPVQYTLGNEGRASLRVDVPEKMIWGATVQDALRCALGIMRRVAFGFATEQGLELSEAAPASTSFPDWVNQREELSDAVDAEFDLRHNWIGYVTEHGPARALITSSHPGREQHEGPGATDGVKEAEWLWEGGVRRKFDAHDARLVAAEEALERTSHVLQVATEQLEELAKLLVKPRG